MFVFFVGAQRIKILYSQDANDSAEHIGLFEIDVNQFGSPVLNMPDGFANVCNLQFRRQLYQSIETVCRWHLSSKVSWFHRQCKVLLQIQDGF